MIRFGVLAFDPFIKKLKKALDYINHVIYTCACPKCTYIEKSRLKDKAVSIL